MNTIVTQAALRKPERISVNQESAMFRDIAVNLSTDEQHDPAAEYALSVASIFEAHVTATAFALEPAVPGSVFENVSAGLLDTQRAEAKSTAEAAIRRFQSKAREAGISTECRLVPGPLLDACDYFSRIARVSDLAVVAQDQPDKSGAEDLFIEAALFGSGRPVLVVPYLQKVPLKLNRILLCSDGGPHAARAIADAMPLLQRAKAVELFTVYDRDRPRELRGADLAHHLARHKLKVELKNAVANDGDVANTILSYAADSSADVIVMGGYGHSWLREFVLGGVTREILSSMTVPTLMAH